MKSWTVLRYLRPPFLQSLLLGAGFLIFQPALAGGPIQAGDMAIVFEQATTPAQLARLLTLKDLNMSATDLKAILDHSRQRLKIQRELDVRGRDTDPVLDPKAMNEEDRNNYFQANPLRRSCIEQSENWKVSAIRVAPFEYSLPGSKAALDAFAKSRQLTGLDRVFQVRFTLNPLCPSLPGSDRSFEFLDIGMHLIFNVWPSEPQLRKSLLQPLQAYLDKNEKSDFHNSQSDLALHLNALTSPGYKSFYNQLMQKFSVLAQSRRSLNANADSFAKLYLDTILSPTFYLSGYTKDGKPYHLPEEQDRATLALRMTADGAYANEDYFNELKSFVAVTSQRPNLERVAVSFLVGGDSWNMAGLLGHKAFQEGVFTKTDNDEAKKIFQSLFPQELKTVQAVMDSKNELSIRKISSSNYFELLGVQRRLNMKKHWAGVEVLEPNLFGQVDFYAESNDKDDGFLQPVPSKQDPIPFSRFLSRSNMINASTTSCATCHAASIITGGGTAATGFTEDLSGADGPEPEQEVRMMGFGKTEGTPIIRAMTLNEVALDAKKLDAYLKAGN